MGWTGLYSRNTKEEEVLRRGRQNEEGGIRVDSGGGGPSGMGMKSNELAIIKTDPLYREFPFIDSANNCRSQSMLIYGNLSDFEAARWNFIFRRILFIVFIIEGLKFDSILFR